MLLDKVGSLVEEAQVAKNYVRVTYLYQVQPQGPEDSFQLTASKKQGSCVMQPQGNGFYQQPEYI